MVSTPHPLNETAERICHTLTERGPLLRIEPIDDSSGARLFDFGVQALGGLDAGCLMSEVCLAGLGRVRVVPGDPNLCPGPAVAIHTDHPVAACLGSQYAGWQIKSETYFAMGSGPMRAAAGREELLETLGLHERPEVAVGVLESGTLPPPDVCFELAQKCGVTPDGLRLLVAATASISGSIQVVARTVETALHKMMELGFDVARVVSGHGVAPLPPVAADDLVAIGRTNDAVLYGGDVTLWVRGDDASLEHILDTIPSCASPDYGQPFAEIFERSDRDFYAIDPHLFSPARICLVNLDSGRMFHAGQTRPEVLRKSFQG